MEQESTKRKREAEAASESRSSAGPGGAARPPTTYPKSKGNGGNTSYGKGWSTEGATTVNELIEMQRRGQIRLMAAHREDTRHSKLIIELPTEAKDVRELLLKGMK